jgi:hypothetical protein
MCVLARFCVPLDAALYLIVESFEGGQRAGGRSFQNRHAKKTKDDKIKRVSSFRLVRQQMKRSQGTQRVGNRNDKKQVLVLVRGH